MSSVSVLLEFEAAQPEAFGLFGTVARSSADAVGAAESLLEPVAGMGVELASEQVPVPMFSTVEQEMPMSALGAFRSGEESEDVTAPTQVVAASVPAAQLEELARNPAVQVWQNSELHFLADRAPAPVDCVPFRPAVSVGDIQALLGLPQVWEQGHMGEGVVVGILDEGVNGATYPVADGFANPGGSGIGSARIESHGSMCAADVLLAAPKATIYDYPFMQAPRSGDALGMFQAVLAHRRLDGTPHLTNNSYGSYAVPPRELLPGHEIWNRNHPLHRKVREVVASGAPAFFAAGNCGSDCPPRKCDATSIGPGKSIHGANSLAEVITVAAVNSQRVRLGYSSQGPGMFEQRKPDLAAYTHFFGNFGPGRPGGEAEPFDSGTSAASPVACGVGALLLGAKPEASPQALKLALLDGTEERPFEGWNADLGAGVVHAGRALASLLGSSWQDV